MVCQFAYWTTIAASGRPSAAPMPTVELISATAEPRRSGGSSSRRMLIDSGTTRRRPLEGAGRDEHAMSEVRAHSTEPTVISAEGRDQDAPLAVHVAGPAEDRGEDGAGQQGAVTIQETAPAEDCRQPGQVGQQGTTTVCMTAMSMPPNARTGTVSRVRSPSRDAVSTATAGSRGSGSGMSTLPSRGRREVNKHSS